MNKKYAVGIDLHGTLLDENWKIEPGLLSQLCALLEQLKKNCSLYVCTGNNLSFIQHYLPRSVRDLIDGYILETGAVYSNGEDEKILITPEEISLVKRLKVTLLDQQLPDVLFFADRSATISIFTKDENKGKSPLNLCKRVKLIVKELGFDQIFKVTHSDVAVDIVTSGTNKYTGIRRVVPLLPVIAIADNDNDKEFLLGADISFIPANSNPAEWQNLCSDIEVKPLQNIKNKNLQDVIKSMAGERTSNYLYKSAFLYTKGLTDILYLINKSMT